MKWTGLNELREQFLSFFESKNHTRLKSFPLLPQGDNSLLLINSGMAPLKKYFLGQETPPNTRVTTCQKCIRTPDIERVGKTSRHGTYFEMLGNFSFGDYFKTEATAWAWEFITKVLEIPEDKLWVSIYLDDDEAFEIWTKQVGVNPDRIVRLGKEDNFWEIGSGPCGPCSEIYFDRGPDPKCTNPNCAVGCDCDRYVEFWNLVFSQYTTDGEGHYELMEKKNIDTGMGLERLACIMQGVDNLFEVDTVANIMKHISEIAGVTYKQNEKTDISLRVITDHIRSTVFMIADGIISSNEGRGYVLRRLLRRAARHGKLLGINDLFLYKVAKTVIKENETAYPELREKEEYITKSIKTEEENFNKTIGKGMELLNGIIKNIKAGNSDKINGEQAFKLYDTYGFPIDLTLEIAGEQQIEVDEEGFNELMQEQKNRAREAYLNSDAVAWSDDCVDLKEFQATQFVGYNEFTCDAKLLAIIKDNQLVESASGDDVVLIFDQTPFYAESGGQIADCGTFVVGSSIVKINDCKKAVSGHYMHFGEIISGSINVNQSGTLTIDAQNRASIARNHTAAHILQKSLQIVLGDHVHQAGQLVTAERLRFDFNHFNAMTSEELCQVEALVNKVILDALDVSIYETDIETAKKNGAMALFGEKYGNIVRVVDAGGFSIELCGGTHCSNTSKLGLFKILSESSVAAGVRRIEATTGIGILSLIDNQNQTICEAAGVLKLNNTAELVSKCQSLVNEMKAKDRELAQIRKELADSKMTSLFNEAVEVDGVKVISAALNNTNVETLRAMSDKLKESRPDSVCVISSIANGKGTIIAVCGKEAISKGMHAGNIVREICMLTGGKGGGRPDSAMGGAGEIFKIDEAMAQLPSVVQKFIKK